MDQKERPNTFAKKEDNDEKVEKVQDIKPQTEPTVNEKIEEWGHVCEEHCMEYKEQAHKYIKENPEKSFFMGMGIGALIALILFRRR